ncbi:PQQ-binding-like beta-propeller repeat protein [Zavarzinella formosa]|uniref:PQQ-binding-like beta-propeller repeat protein n=1 Tax=Zavarzinella formosa TaxID=360055 RepID=UPI0002D62EFF|nr:PQQ-binding-like beta-propeller repeat protein [Zavarzinella formosa]
MRFFVTLLFLVVLSPAWAAETDWPQFRGPKRDDLSPDKGLLKKWPAEGPMLAWKSDDVGLGFSSVAIQGDFVVTMGDIGKNGCYLIATSRSTGKKLWQTKVGEVGGGGGYPGPRCTPTIDGDMAYGLGQYGDLLAVSLKDGSEVWRTNLGKEHGGKAGGWGYAESVLVDGENLVCTPGGAAATLLCVNKKDGKPVWRGAVTGGDQAGYSSVVISNATGVKQYVTLLANSLVGFAAKDGTLLWRYGNTKERFQGNTANIPTTIVKGNQLFAVAGYGRGAALLTLSGQGGKINVKEEYWSPQLKNKHGGVIQVGEYLYGDFDDSGNIWCAAAKTGKISWTRKDDSGGERSASMTFADGLLFVRFQNGVVALAEANPAKYNLLSSFKVPNGNGNCWAHPVVIGGKMYIREKETIWCYDVAAKK